MDEESRKTGVILVSLGSGIVTPHYIRYVINADRFNDFAFQIILLDSPEVTNSIHLHGMLEVDARRHVDAQCRQFIYDFSLLGIDAEIKRASDYEGDESYLSIEAELSRKYQESRSFQSHCDNQVFRNLQPQLRKCGVMSKRDSKVKTLVPYLLQELALLFRIAEVEPGARVISPEEIMDLIKGIYAGQYESLERYIVNKVEHITVPSPDFLSPIIIDELSFKYRGGNFSFNALNLRIPHGVRVGIIGANGSGKSTLLNLLGGHLIPKSGEIKRGDNSLRPLSSGDRQTRTVFQDHALFPHYSVGDNVFFPLRAKYRISKREKEEAIAPFLRRFRLTELASSYPNALSGGEKQRVALARALVDMPDILLLDEPTASLDTPQKNALSLFLIDLYQSDQSPTVVIVSHDFDFIFSVCNYIVILDKGKISASGNTDYILNYPPNVHSAALCDNHNILNGYINGNCLFEPDCHCSSFQVPDAYEQFADSRSAVLLPMSEASLGGGDGKKMRILEAPIRAITAQRDGVKVTVRNGSRPFSLYCTKEEASKLKVGDTVDIFYPRESVIVVNDTK